MTCADDPPAAIGPESDFDPAALDDEQLTDAVCRYSAQVAASTCRFVLLAAELDRREGAWSETGVRSFAHWLNWQCGLSMGTAREHLRVGHALANLHAVRRSFMAGEISYSKVRAITRIATPATEEALVEMAGLMTASALETVCHCYRVVEDEDRRLAEAEQMRTRQAVRHWTNPEGQVVIYAELAPDEGAVVVAALEASLRSLREERLTAVEAENRARAEAPSAESDGASTQASADSPDVPAETSPPWPTPADALVSMAEASLAAGSAGCDRPESTRVVLHIDQRVLEDRSNQGCCHIESVGVVPVAMAERMLCDSTVRTVRYTQDGIDLSSPSRTVPERIHRALRIRDGGCRFPGCDVTRHLHAHHVRWASQGGTTEMSNLCYLCSYHHHLVHEGGYSITLSEAGDVTVRDPAGSVLHEAHGPFLPAGEVPGAGPMHYGGEPFRMDDVMDVLFQMGDPSDDEPPEWSAP